MSANLEDDDLGSLYDRFGAALYRYALMILGDTGLAEDAVQDVFLSVARNRRRTVENTAAYLRQAVRNACYTSLRKRRHDRHAGGGEEHLLESAQDGASPEERLALESALRRLPPEQREVVHLKASEGLTFREIADCCGESINTVAGRYRYALEKLRRELGAGDQS
jgi:RNA polymerase sigma-70 factor (ECF subfamily)